MIESYINAICPEEYDKIEIKKFYHSLQESEITRTQSALISLLASTILNLIMLSIEIIPMVVKRIKNEEYLDQIKEITGDPDIKIFLIPSDVPNAFNMGTKSLYITKGLIDILNRNEIISVLLHEYGHKVGQHVVKKILTIMGSNLLLSYFITFASKDIGIGIIFSKAASYFIQIMFGVTIGRKYEYFADSYSSKMGYGKYLISALNKLDNWSKKIICKDLIKDECDNLFKSIQTMDEHPELDDRIQGILKNSFFKSLVISGQIQRAKKWLHNLIDLSENERI